MRVLVFGHGGYIGSEICHELLLRDIDLSILSSRNWDSASSLEKYIWSRKPDVIINCSAYTGKTSIADCELRKDETISSNVLFVNTLLDICSRNGITLGHFSSGCIYNGYVSNGYTENDEPNLSFRQNNCSFYTGTKVLAEEVLKPYNKKYIWRIRLPFDEIHHDRNYLSKILKYERLVVANNSITHRKDAAKACIDSITMGIPFGTYNLTNPGAMDAHDLVARMKHYGVMPEDTVKKYESIEEFNKTSSIPRSNTYLNTYKLEDAGVRVRSCQDAVNDSLKNWRWS